MLPHEIEPFADHHIEELKAVERLLTDLSESPDVAFPEALVEASLNRVKSAQRALYRFKVCMADEVKMKERFRIQARDCRLHHKDL